MKAYPSIETVFVRDHATNLLNFGEIRCPENDCIRSWTISEKIDGTNIRAIVTLEGIGVRGRTDKADLPPGLASAVLAALPSHERLLEYFTAYRGKELPAEWSVTFYGEGYGAGIQKGGCYSAIKKFRVFDLLLGENWWTSDKEMRRVCDELDIPTVPYLTHRSCYMSDEWSLAACFQKMDGKPISTVAYLDSNNFTQPEGIVAKPDAALFNHRGDRVMWKLTFREFNKQAKGQKQQPTEARQ